MGQEERIAVVACGLLHFIAFSRKYRKGLHVRNRSCALQRMALHRTLQAIAPSSNGLGNEKDVIGAAFGLGMNSVSKGIVGNSGVFFVQPYNKKDAGTFTNIPGLKSQLSTAAKSQVNGGLLNALKKGADIEDSRATFF